MPVVAESPYLRAALAAELQRFLPAAAVLDAAEDLVDKGDGR